MWILFSLIAALSDTTRMAINKHLSSKSDPYSMFYFMLLYGMPFTAVAAYFTFGGLPFSNIHFLVSAIIGATVMAVGSFMLADASRRCDISIIAPIIGLTPIFIVPIEYFALGALPNIYGISGIVLVVIGSYILNLSTIKIGGLLGPIKALFKLNGGLIPFLISVIFAFGATANRYALQYTDSMSYSVWLIVGTFVIATIYLFGIKRRFDKNFELDAKLVSMPGWSILQGLVFVSMIYAELYAITLINASYMISIKRLAALFGVIVGYFIFREKNIRERAFGAVLMVIGVVILSVFG